MRRRGRRPAVCLAGSGHTGRSPESLLEPQQGLLEMEARAACSQLEQVRDSEGRTEAPPRTAHLPTPAVCARPAPGVLRPTRDPPPPPPGNPVRSLVVRYFMMQEDVHSVCGKSRLKTVIIILKIHVDVIFQTFYNKYMLHLKGEKNDESHLKNMYTCNPWSTKSAWRNPR